MPTEPTSEITLIEATPAPPQVAKTSRAAIKRCVAARQRVYEAYLEGTERNSGNKAYASYLAGPAYCGAMPLTDYENIRNFIACAAHGILIGAIPEKRANQVLYAAQIALASLNFEPKTRKSA